MAAPPCANTDSSNIEDMELKEGRRHDPQTRNGFVKPLTKFLTERKTRTAEEEAETMKSNLLREFGSPIVQRYF